MKNKNSTYVFSLFKNLYVKTPEGSIDVNQLIEFVKYPYLESKIDHLRSLDQVEYKNQKKSLPAVTLSGVFSGRKNSCLIEHSGLMQIDFDAVENYNEHRKALIEDPYTYVLFQSPSGKGIKMLVKVYPSVDTHKAQFFALEKYYLEEYRLKMDTGTKDVTRTMLLSYDPDLYCNPFSETFKKVIEQKKYKQNKIVLNTVKDQKAIYHTQNRLEGREEYLVNKLCDSVKERKIDFQSPHLDRSHRFNSRTMA